MITILDLNAEFAKLTTLEKCSANAEHLTVDIEDPRTLIAAQLTGSTEEKWR